MTPAPLDRGTVAVADVAAPLTRAAPDEAALVTAATPAPAAAAPVLVARAADEETARAVDVAAGAAVVALDEDAALDDYSRSVSRYPFDSRL